MGGGGWEESCVQKKYTYVKKIKNNSACFIFNPPKRKYRSILSAVNMRYSDNSI